MRWSALVAPGSALALRALRPAARRRKPAASFDRHVPFFAVRCAPVIGDLAGWRRLLEIAF
jgi:hypothetical protein